MTLGQAKNAILDGLRGQIDPSCWREIEPRYLEEPRNLLSGRAMAVLAPNTVEDVATIVKFANSLCIPVVPYGGGTGLVGGQVMDGETAPLLISLERMNKVRDVNPADSTITTEAGVILQDLQVAAADVGRLFPLSLASQGTCQIGGNLATNAGGVNVLRYGSARDLCLGLEAVLPSGEIWHGLKRLRKDNTGYDLRNLLIGAEGTLGIITAATLRLFAQPPQMGAALMVVRDPAAALDLLTLARRFAGETISAFELIDGTGLEFLTETMPDTRQPFDNAPKWSVLIDVGATEGIDPPTLLEQIFSAGCDAGLVSDGVISQSMAQRDEFWSLRENIPAANKRIGPVSSHDISLPVGSVSGFITECSEKIAALGDFRINTFGHLGDGNLHFNVFPGKGRTRTDYPNQGDTIRRLVYDQVAEYGGSFSAEHGIGRLKTEELKRYGDPAKRTAMLAIKSALDPNGIMNPGVIFGE